MKREHLEHIIRAAGAIAQVKEIIIIGSQAILGSYTNPPKNLIVSMEVDLYPPENMILKKVDITNILSELSIENKKMIITSLKQI